MSRPLRYPLTVFYDGSCPLCASEMRALRKREHHGRLEFVDCSAPKFDDSVLAGTAISREDLMEHIHARDAHGRWFRGIDVLEAAYAAAGVTSMAAVLRSRGLRPWLTRGYSWIARNRRLLSRLH